MRSTDETFIFDFKIYEQILKILLDRIKDFDKTANFYFCLFRTERIFWQSQICFLAKSMKWINASSSQNLKFF